MGTNSGANPTNPTPSPAPTPSPRSIHSPLSILSIPNVQKPDKCRAPQKKKQQSIVLHIRHKSFVVFPSPFLLHSTISFSNLTHLLHHTSIHHPLRPHFPPPPPHR